MLPPRLDPFPASPAGYAALADEARYQLSVAQELAVHRDVQAAQVSGERLDVIAASGVPRGVGQDRFVRTNRFRVNRREFQRSLRRRSKSASATRKSAMAACSRRSKEASASRS